MQKGFAPAFGGKISIYFMFHALRERLSTLNLAKDYCKPAYILTTIMTLR